MKLKIKVNEKKFYYVMRKLKKQTTTLSLNNKII